MLKRILQVQKVLVLLVVVMLLFTIWTYVKFDAIIKIMSQNVTNMELRSVKRIAKAIGSSIELEIKDNMFKELKKNTLLRKKLNKLLSIYVNKEVKYVYVVYKDKRGVYRYLLDGSRPKKERGAFNQIFIPINGIWNVCFKTKKDAFSVQKNIRFLWITYLHPIIIKGKIQAILALDISSLINKKINSTLLPLKLYLQYLVSFILFVIFVTVLQLYMFMRERQASRIDALTRLFNRNYLKETKESINLNRIAVAMVDIDHFKNVNDTFGHDAGDIVLSNVAKRLIIYTRAEDIVIRYGGEEFLIIFKIKNIKNDIQNIINVAQRIQRQISENPVRVDGAGGINVTVSMGVDPYTYKRKSLEESISIADLMLYAAKKKGRNRVEIAKN